MGFVNDHIRHALRYGGMVNIPMGRLNAFLCQLVFPVIAVLNAGTTQKRGHSGTLELAAMVSAASIYSGRFFAS